MVGDPKDDKTFTGALISKEHLAKVKGYVDVAEKEGATILCGKEELSLSDRNKNVRTCPSKYFMPQPVFNGGGGWYIGLLMSVCPSVCLYNCL